MLNLLSEPAAPNTFEKIVIFLQAKNVPHPGNYGWFHLMFVALAIIATVLLCIYFRDASDKIFRRILWISWMIILIFEIYKQIVFSYNYDAETGLGSWHYGWGSFPFQLCSTAMYLLPFAVWLKDSKLRDSVLSFLALFSLFGGLCVYVFPNDVFNTDLLGVQIQTMVHHGVQIVIAFYIFAHERKRFNFMFFLNSILTFIVMLAIAMTLNIIGHAAIEGTFFNMFYISPYYSCTLPVLQKLYTLPEPTVPYALFLIIYIVGFVLCAFIMFAIQFIITKICQKIYASTRK